MSQFSYGNLSMSFTSDSNAEEISKEVQEKVEGTFWKKRHKGTQERKNDRSEPVKHRNSNSNKSAIETRVEELQKRIARLSQSVGQDESLKAKNVNLNSQQSRRPNVNLNSQQRRPPNGSLNSQQSRRPNVNLNSQQRRPPNGGLNSQQSRRPNVNLNSQQRRPPNGSLNSQQSRRPNVNFNSQQSRRPNRDVAKVSNQEKKKRELEEKIALLSQRVKGATQNEVSSHTEAANTQYNRSAFNSHSQRYLTPFTNTQNRTQFTETTQDFAQKQVTSTQFSQANQHFAQKQANRTLLSQASQDFSQRLVNQTQITQASQDIRENRFSQSQQGLNNTQNLSNNRLQPVSNRGISGQNRLEKGKSTTIPTTKNVDPRVSNQEGNSSSQRTGRQRQQFTVPRMNKPSSNLNPNRSGFNTVKSTAMRRETSRAKTGKRTAVSSQFNCPIGYMTTQSFVEDPVKLGMLPGIVRDDDSQDKASQSSQIAHQTDTAFSQDPIHIENDTIMMNQSDNRPKRLVQSTLPVQISHRKVENVETPLLDSRHRKKPTLGSILQDKTNKAPGPQKKACTTTVKKTAGRLNSITPMRRIPGPVGDLLKKHSTTRKRKKKTISPGDDVINEVVDIDVEHGDVLDDSQSQQAESQHTVENENHFLKGPWLEMKRKYGKEDSLENGIVVESFTGEEEEEENVHPLRTNTISKILYDGHGDNQKVPFLAARIAKIQWLESGAIAYLTDPTGTIESEVHNHVLENPAHDFVEGAVLVLQNVTIYRPQYIRNGCATHSVIITTKNIIEILSPSTVHQNPNEEEDNDNDSNSVNHIGNNNPVRLRFSQIDLPKSKSSTQSQAHNLNREEDDLEAWLRANAKENTQFFIDEDKESPKTQSKREVQDLTSREILSIMSTPSVATSKRKPEHPPVHINEPASRKQRAAVDGEQLELNTAPGRSNSKPIHQPQKQPVQEKDLVSKSATGSLTSAKLTLPSGQLAVAPRNVEEKPRRGSLDSPYEDIEFDISSPIPHKEVRKEQKKGSEQMNQFSEFALDCRPKSTTKTKSIKSPAVTDIKSPAVTDISVSETKQMDVNDDAWFDDTPIKPKKSLCQNHNNNTFMGEDNQGLNDFKGVDQAKRREGDDDTWFDDENISEEEFHFDKNQTFDKEVKSGTIFDVKNSTEKEEKSEPIISAEKSNTREEKSEPIISAEKSNTREKKSEPTISAEKSNKKEEKSDPILDSEKSNKKEEKSDPIDVNDDAWFDDNDDIEF